MRRDRGDQAQAEAEASVRAEQMDALPSADRRAEEFAAAVKVHGRVHPGLKVGPLGFGNLRTNSRSRRADNKRWRPTPAKADAQGLTDPEASAQSMLSHGRADLQQAVAPSSRR